MGVIETYRHLRETARISYSILEAIRTAKPSLPLARSAASVVERLARFPDEDSDQLFEFASGQYVKNQFQAIIEELRYLAIEMKSSTAKDAISGVWRDVHMYSDSFEHVLNAFTDTLNEAHRNPLIADWTLALIAAPDGEAAIEVAADGPLPDRIAFRYAGIVYEEGLEPIVWRFLKATFWRIGEHVAARDIYKLVWQDDVTDETWRRSPDEVLTENQAKEVVTKTNAFLRTTGPAPFHASQNASTGVRVFALLDGPPRARSRKKLRKPKQS